MPKTDYQRLINNICSDIIPEPHFKYLFMKVFSPARIGYGSVTWPGGQIYNSTIGVHCGLGMSTVITDSVVGDHSIVCSKAEVTEAEIGDHCFVAANARVTGKIPDRSFVTGTNRIRPRNFEPKPTRRNLTKIRFEGYPVWDWEIVLREFGIYRFLSLVPQHFFTNSIANKSRNSRSKTTLSRIYCNVEKGAEIHYSAVLDSMFPQNIYIRSGAVIGADSLILTHSFVDEAGYVLERGTNEVGENARVGADRGGLPGVEIPPDVRIPPSSLVTVSGPYLIKENEKLGWDDIR